MCEREKQREVGGRRREGKREGKREKEGGREGRGEGESKISNAPS